MSTLNNPKVYRSVRVIAQRLGVSPTAIGPLRRDYGLPLFYDSSPKKVWMTTEEALLDWQWLRARLDREYRKLEKAWGLQPLQGSGYGRERYLAVMKRYRQLTVEQIGNGEEKE